MTTVHSSPFLEKPAESTLTPAASARWDRVEAALERAGERLNPILVKEARQALKSKQFVVTFTLLLMCGWGWSLLGIALMSPGVYYAPAGPSMLLGYYFVLAVPLLVVVPFAAFRSLASEREDGTYELLSITALSPRLIITGKLGSAILQMIVYYSALTPCIVFTYILRGVDIVSIGVVLFWTFLFSVGLSVVGLLFATATRSRNWQVLFSVVFLLALLFVGFLWSLAVVQILGYGGTPAYDEPDFWLGMAACLTGYVAAFVLFIQAAAAQIMFVSANRSTALRATMFVHQLLWVGWVMFFWIHYELDELFLVLMMFAAFYWAIVGALMTGEAPQLSPRARRSLPQSFLGRAFLTWLNPGSGTGYAFAVSNLFALAVVSIIAGGVANLVGFDGKPDDGWWIAFSLMAVAYVAAYLGVGRLVLLFLRRYIWGGLPMAFVIQVFIAAMGALLPFLIQFTSRWGAFIDEYTLMQVSNWAWTMYAIADEDLAGTDLAAYVIVPSFAAVVFVLNMVFAAREVAAEHEQTPQRVIEDEIQLHPEKAPKPPGPQNPWDYDAPPEPATS
jgi:ABC-type transport system involved in multi-copper enzyme maturation permease subunit